MKTQYKKLTSLLLAALLLISMLAVNAQTVSLTYSFSGADASRAGFAEGTISFSAASGTYSLYWADDEKALDGYYPLATLSFTSSGTKTHKMVERSAIPAGATKLIATVGDKTVRNAYAVFDIPQSKRFPYELNQQKYRFASYSDVHIDNTKNTYKYCEEHWRSALDTAAARQAQFVVLSGDYVNNNIDYSGISTSEWKTYSDIVADSDFCNPVYEAIGNHELWQSVSKGEDDFITRTGLEGSNGDTTEKTYFEKTLGGDHFLFMALEGGFYPDRTEQFTTEQLNWLEGRLMKYSGDGSNIYLIEHSLIHKYGAGDRTDGEPYYDIPLGENLASTIRFKSLLERYKDVIFLSGHTHIAFKEQYNFSDNGGKSAQMIHNSSVGGTRPIVNGSMDRSYPLDQTEGYIVDVFDGAIVFNGANLYYNLYDPNCCYIVKTSGEIYEQMSKTEPAEPTPVTTPTQPATISQSAYYVKGTFNGWGTTNPLYTTSDSNIVLTTIQLAAGSYKFKLNSGSTWYGNGGTIEDTTKKTSNGGWIMGESDGDCTLNASGGYYTFNFNTSTKKLNLLYSASDPYGAQTPTEPQVIAVPESAPPESLTEPEEILWGDVNLDEKINIRDVTMIQLAALNKINLSKKQQLCADVDADLAVNVNDASKIQQYLLKKFDSFFYGTDIKATAESTLKNKKALASYDAYMALKKVFRTGGAGSLLALYNKELLDISPEQGGGEVETGFTLYFEKPDSWGTPNAYCWGRNGVGNEGAWPGTAMSFVGTSGFGKKIYKYEVNDAVHNYIIFNDGTNQTADILMTSDNLVYYYDVDNTLKTYSFNPSFVS